MDENFGGAYLDECDDWRNRYREAIDEAREEKMKVKQKTQLDQLFDEIAGWTVVRVGYHQLEEEIFTLVVEKNGKRKSIEICATDPSWWMGNVW